MRAILPRRANGSLDSCLGMICKTNLSDCEMPPGRRLGRRTLATGFVCVSHSPFFSHNFRLQIHVYGVYMNMYTMYTYESTF